MTSTDLSRNALGSYGESLAARYLTDRGLVVLDRNWRCPQGEIDLVLREASTLVICEVKTRRSAEFGHPLEAVTEQKLHRLRILAVAWLRAHSVKAKDVRIDLVSVVQPVRGPAQIEHVPGVG